MITKEELTNILNKQNLMSVATQGSTYPDNSIVCFAYEIDNELYIIKPYVIWNYNPSKGEMHRDVYILNQKYYDELEVYEPHKYQKR